MKHLELKAIAVLFVAAAPALWANAPKDQYTNLVNGTVRDNKTGLVWQRQAQASSSWDSANAICKSLSLGAFASGWRVPTKLELETLVDYRALPSTPFIDTIAFPSAPLGVFWTATTVESCSDAGPCETLACGVDFRTGLEDLFTKSQQSFLVRCVHGP